MCNQKAKKNRALSLAMIIAFIVVASAIVIAAVWFFIVDFSISNSRNNYDKVDDFLSGDYVLTSDNGEIKIYNIDVAMGNDDKTYTATDYAIINDDESKQYNAYCALDLNDDDPDYNYLCLGGSTSPRTPPRYTVLYPISIMTTLRLF